MPFFYLAFRCQHNANILHKNTKTPKHQVEPSLYKMCEAPCTKEEHSSSAWQSVMDESSEAE